MNTFKERVKAAFAKYPRLPPRRFTANNSGAASHEPQPWQRAKAGEGWTLPDGWSVAGWMENEKLGHMARLKDDRKTPEDMLAVMFNCPEGYDYPDVWFHTSKYFLLWLKTP